MSQLVMIVDDEPGILSTLSDVLTDEGYRTITTPSGTEAQELYRKNRPDVVFLDIWLPDRDGLETLQALRELDPAAAVIMMSGHGSAETAVKAIKMGAHNYLEKPLSYNRAVRAVEDALEYRQSVSSDSLLLETLERTKERIDTELNLEPPPRPAMVQQTDVPQRTIRRPTVLYGLGLHSGRPTGMALQPLPPDTGIHFITVPTGIHLPAYVTSVTHTGHATTLARDGAEIKTVEHLLSALHARGITNLLVKVHGEIPVLDGSALEFCEALDETGIEDQSEGRWELVIDRPYKVESEGGKILTIEPFDGFAVSYHLSYPPPVGDQTFEFVMTDYESYRDQVAPARTFGFVRDLQMMAELGLGSGGRLDNFILVGEDGVINTELRFPDEFARHKALDIIGDSYLLGYPIRGRIEAHLTGHRANIALLREILGQAASVSNNSGS